MKHFLSWQFNETVDGDRKYLNDNKNFIQLVNILLTNGHIVPEDHLKTIRYRFLNEKSSIECGSYGKLKDYKDLAEELIKKYQNVSSQPIYSHEVTEETLETAAEIYFQLVHCPTDNVEMKDFYLKLIKDFPLSTLLITLARLTSAGMESKSVKLDSARLILLRLTDILDLDYRRIIAVTTAQSHLVKGKKRFFVFFSHQKLLK